MCYRRLILKRVNDFFKAHPEPGSYLSLDPIEIVGKPLPGKEGEKYAAAVGQLLTEKLIVGVSIGEGKTAYSVNPNRIDDVRKELLWWRNPTVQWLVGSLIALIGLILALIAFVLPKK
jgi:hypothetical protein